MSTKLRGKVSTFGGPKDKGVGASEGLALVDSNNLHLVKDYFLPEQPPGTTGLARRLNPKTYYIACRWDYKVTSRASLLNRLVEVTNPRTKKSAKAKPVDWGPNEKTNRVADISPGLADYLGVQTDDVVEVTLD